MDNGFHPIFNEKFSFDIHCIDLAYISFIIFNKNDNFIAENLFPLNKVKNGYRFVMMKDLSQNIIESCGLFVHIDLSEVNKN
jgi:hypothetical protein